MGRQSLRSPTQRCLPHSRHFIPSSFRLNFPALTVQSGSYPVTIVTSLEVFGQPCSLMFCGRCLYPRTKAPVCYFLRRRENLSLSCVKALQGPAGPCCWRLSLTFILHFSCWQVAGLWRPNNLDRRKEETCKSAFWSHGQPEKD